MAEIELSEFPFVAELPKREKSKVAIAIDIWNEIKAINKRDGGVLPREFCATLANVSKQRVAELVENGTLKTIMIGSQAMVTGDSFEAWMKSDRKPGRPKKTTTGEKAKILFGMLKRTSNEMSERHSKKK